MKSSIIPSSPLCQNNTYVMVTYEPILDRILNFISDNITKTFTIKRIDHIYFIWFPKISQLKLTELEVYLKLVSFSSYIPKYLVGFNKSQDFNVIYHETDLIITIRLSVDLNALFFVHKPNSNYLIKIIHPTEIEYFKRLFNPLSNEPAKEMVPYLLTNIFNKMAEIDILTYNFVNSEQDLKELTDFYKALIK